jgi:hypothetical protein
MVKKMETKVAAWHILLPALTAERVTSFLTSENSHGKNLLPILPPGDKTVVAGLDDATPGQVYFYIGTKTTTGTEIEKAGLSNGNLYGPRCERQCW